MTDVDLALAALDGNPNPLDMDTRDIDPDPTSLDMPEEKCQTMRSPHRSHTAADACIVCGSPLCEDCVSPFAAGDED
jgi:hypothetical protein